MLNALPFQLNATLQGASGVATFIGDCYQDEGGREYRAVLATDEALIRGQVCIFKPDDGVSGVIASNTASGVGEVFAGVLVTASGCSAGDLAWVQYKGEAFAVTAADSIAIGDNLVSSTSGTLAEEVSYGGEDGGVAVSTTLAKALQAGAGDGDVSVTRVLIE